MFQKWLQNESGATAIEYALIAGLLSIAIVVGLTAVGTTVNSKFTIVAEGFGR